MGPAATQQLRGAAELPHRFERQKAASGGRNKRPDATLSPPAGSHRDGPRVRFEQIALALHRYFVDSCFEGATYGYTAPYNWGSQ